MFCVVRSDEFGLIGEEIVAIEVEECCFDVVVQVFEQQVIAALDQAKVEVVGSIDEIAICDREITDGVFAFGELEGVGAFTAGQGVLAFAAKEGVVARSAMEAVVECVTFEKVIT